MLAGMSTRASRTTDAQSAVTFLVLGAGGDLTQRLLLPGLGSLLAQEPERDIRIIGADRADLDDDSFGELVADRLRQGKAKAATARKVARRARYVQADLLDVDALTELVQSAGDDLVIYFALPPAISMKVCAQLEKIDLPRRTRLGLEKPFGADVKSARAFNAQLQRVVPEERIFRVDHFLGRSTVLNLIGLRFSNRLLQPVWNSEHIERVEIVYDEDLALEGRAGYYDNAGALRDMLQSHLLQIMAIFAIEPIADLSPQELADLKAQVLRATRLWKGEVKKSVKRARYTAGTIGDRTIPAYASEDGVDPSKKTETLAQMTLEIRNNRWAGVPFVLRSGKGMGESRKQIDVVFKPVDHLPKGFIGCHGPDKLEIKLKPGELGLRLSMNAEGDPFDLEQKTLRATLNEAKMEPYGEVLKHIFDDNQLLSVRADAAELCWKIVAPALRAFDQDRIPLEEYPAGSAGPQEWLPEDAPTCQG